jgi:hypothetical protein
MLEAGLQNVADLMTRSCKATKWLRESSCLSEAELQAQRSVMNAKTIYPTAEMQCTTEGRRRYLAEISFCLTIDHCRTILYYTVLFQDLAPR